MVEIMYNTSGVTYENLTFYYVDTLAYFSCDPGYSLSGSSSSICQTFGGGTWNPETPTCIQEGILLFLKFLMQNFITKIGYLLISIQLAKQSKIIKHLNDN